MDIATTKRLIKACIEKLDSQGKDTGEVVIDGYTINIVTTGSLGYEGYIESKHGFVIADFEYNNIEQKFTLLKRY